MRPKYRNRATAFWPIPREVNLLLLLQVGVVTTPVLVFEITGVVAVIIVALERVKMDVLGSRTVGLEVVVVVVVGCAEVMEKK